MGTGGGRKPQNQLYIFQSCLCVEGKWAGVVLEEAIDPIQAVSHKIMTESQVSLFSFLKKLFLFYMRWCFACVCLCDGAGIPGTGYR